MLETLKNILSKLFFALLTVAIIILLFTVDIKKMLSYVPGIFVFKKNLDFIDGTLESYLLLIVFVGLFIVTCIVKNRVSITIPSISFGGIEIYLKNTEKVVKANMRNYLNTKRSLFYINETADNFYDVFLSYHGVYEHIREQMSIFEDTKNTDNECYEKLDNMITALNNFLTRFQSNYRRWYEKESEKEFRMLNELQPMYPVYAEMIESFHDVNEKMRDYAEYFGVNVQKWNIDKGSEQN